MIKNKGLCAANMMVRSGPSNEQIAGKKIRKEKRDDNDRLRQRLRKEVSENSMIIGDLECMFYKFYLYNKRHVF